MTNPVYAFIEKHAGPRFAQAAAGIAADFWKDTPCDFPLIPVTVKGRTFKIPNIFRPLPKQPAAAAPGVMISNPVQPLPAKSEGPLWHAAPGELAEKMWGPEQTLPAGDAILAMLTGPPGSTKDKTIIDLTAGLGGSLRKLLTQFNQVKGLEPNALVAARGMELSARSGKAKQAPIEAYDLANFSMPGIYDYVMARELFYRIADKPKFFYSIAAGIKSQGRVIFTDYIVDPENRQQPSILAWQAQEPAAKPLGLIEMAEAWALVGFELRESEDQTAFYRREITNGVNRFVAALRAAPTADAETKKAILAETGTWIQRLAAIQQGMKFYRFHAIKV